MNEQELARFENEAAETVGAMKELFKEFERRLGEVVSAQRLASSEARSESVKAQALLGELSRAAQASANAQRQALTELREGWRLHVAENSKAAGREHAHAFGEEIAAGLTHRLSALAATVERATARLGWLSALKWSAGIAAGIALTIAIGVWSLVPSVEGLNSLQVRAAMAQLVPCQIGVQIHVCVTVDETQRVGKASKGVGVVLVNTL